MVRRTRVTAPEIAERYDRALSTVQRIWTQRPDWPHPVGKRGRWHEYDADQVDAVVSGAILRETPAPAGDPDELLTMQQVADHTGLAYGTVRADASRGRLGEPDETKDGVKRWKRATIDAVMRGRRGYHRGRS